MRIENILNFREINNDIATAGQPNEDELRLLKNEGYECVLNMAPYDTRYSLNDEEGMVKSLDMEYLYQPVDFIHPKLEDYYEFENNLKKVKNKKTLIHCAANYRVSVFFSHYASKHFNWSIDKCDDHISGVWNVDEFPIWSGFVEHLRNADTGDSENATIENQDKLDQITNIINKYMVVTADDKFKSEGLYVIQNSLNKFVRDNKKIDFILPGFPCKSPNKVDKTFGTLPDFGEALALEHLDSFCDEINSIYEAGCELTILCDGTTFSDIVGVPEEEKNIYKYGLQDLTVTNNIEWVDLSAFFEKRMSDDGFRKQLIAQSNKKLTTLDKFINKVKKDEKLTAEHDKWCTYLYNDMSLETVSEGSRDEYLHELSNKSYEIMYRGQALSANIERTFPNHVRLSVHQYSNAGPKFTICLIPGAKRAVAPWHTVPLRMQDGSFKLIPHGEINNKLMALVTSQGNNWFYMEIESEELTQFSYEVVKAPRFGLIVKDDNNVGLDKLPVTFLTALIADFGFVVLKGMKFDDQKELVEHCQPFGEMYQWDFGPVHVVKPEDKPEGFVHSTEKTPLHWDLSMLPLNHKKVVGNEYFCAKMFFLYCKKSSKKGGGETTIVDSRVALRLAGREKIEKWKNTHVTYFTKMTYFGGAPRTYPLVFKHPNNDEFIFRYQEESDSELQKFTLSSEEIASAEFNKIIGDVNAIAYDDRCMVPYDWEDHDLVLVDNYHTLHGRLPMTSTSRELWRVQII